MIMNDDIVGLIKQFGWAAAATRPPLGLTLRNNLACRFRESQVDYRHGAATTQSLKLGPSPMNCQIMIGGKILTL